jgi:3-isopropylmalate/(R)-2-methylmalate dehydratase small subunit
MPEIHIKVSSVEGKAVPVHGNDIDTDQIIPARFMKCVTFDGLGEYVFHDVRYDENGNLKGHPFDDERYADAGIMIVNSNFGCGSSREHAPQALAHYGIRGIIGESYAEIFAGNCTSMGIPAVTLPASDIKQLVAEVEKDPGMTVRIDLANGAVIAGPNRYHFEIPAAFKKSLIDGSWDSTAVLLENIDAVEKTAASLPYLNGFRRAG